MGEIRQRINPNAVTALILTGAMDVGPLPQIQGNMFGSFWGAKKD
jgi:hypothetical protein